MQQKIKHVMDGTNIFADDIGFVLNAEFFIDSITFFSFIQETVQENATVERLARMDEKRYDSYYRYPDEYHTDVLKQLKQRSTHVWYPRV